MIIYASIVLDRKVEIRVPISDTDSKLFQPFNLLVDTGTVDNTGGDKLYLRGSPLVSNYQQLEIQYLSLPRWCNFLFRKRVKRIEDYVKTKKQYITRKLYLRIPEQIENLENET